MSGSVLITGAQRVDGVDRPLLVSGDRIGGDLDGADRIDATELHLAPGIVDLGAFAVDLQACLFGGITRVALMPDGNPPLDGPGLIQRAAIAAKPHLWVHPLAAATQRLEGTALAEIGLMKGAGARAVATGRRWIADSGLMQSVLAYSAALDLTVVTHAEDDGLVAGAVATAGEAATRLGLPAAPSCAEAIAIARDIALAEVTGARLHLRQVTTGAGFDLVRRAKDRGLAVTCGITPAHLLLSDTAIGDFRTFAHLSPPLRDERDRHAALDALADGTVDVLHSGHDPRGPEDKRLPFADSAPGMAAAGHLLALGLGLVRDGHVGMARLFDLLARNPARLLGIDAGHLGDGGPADLILFDPDAPWQISSDRMPSQAGNTPFDGLPVQGRVRRVMKGGRWLS
ncbi:dihydroorotase [Sphingomonas jejuensis]|uniref:Dihydroorotase n=1 Tax=Sphingomonas jejuensis TaxID=904715 RepID=A0ABX0XIS5_9SPHN|nr:dihydroorotase [Sphingomonas jejuensis]NJC33238.1 dihydroorotase [Sphingomonas jejuensis]